ncbi:MAG: UDP-2,3-diacylglucosamine diphosphatase [Prevotellaceae bacterium]|nr:UDP-2,3-diacylglucosamine diphosphatase [Prevotellaceae bacterium]
MKNVYFISDAHLGSLALGHRRQQERRLVRFLDEIKGRAEAVYMLGDMFDFWFEYGSAVPKGFTRFLGKVSELTDMGIEVHFFAGNHDTWCFGYLESECGMTVHRGARTLHIGDKTFFLAHGDGLGDSDRSFRLLRSVFHNKLCQGAFRWLHPDLGLPFGLAWAKHSRLRHSSPSEPPYLGEDREPLVSFAKAYLSRHPDVDYFIFGHRHIELDLALSRQTRVIVLGDWISQFTYAVYDGERLSLESYTEGEQPL